MPSSGSSTGDYGVGAIPLIPSGSYYPGGAQGCSGGTCTSLPQTDATGVFTITGDYTCTEGQQVYALATGGNPGLGGTVNNQYIALIAALGACPSTGTLAGNVPFVNINEVTTVATVWALQQFMAAPAPGNYLAPSIGAPSGPAGGYGGSGVQSAVQGMVNAFNMVPNLVDISLGSSNPPKNSWATPEYAKIYTIADILAYCVNTDPISSTNCATLMNDATPASSTIAADTIQAAWYMAQNPMNNISALFAHATATPPFPGLSAAPKDWTVAVGLQPLTSSSATALQSPIAIAFDTYGNGWITSNGAYNTTGPVVVAQPNLAEVAPDGRIITQPITSYTASGGLTTTATQGATHTLTESTSSGGPKGVAVDLGNNAWIGNTFETSSGSPAAQTVVKVTGSLAAGQAAGGTTSGYFTYTQPYNLAVDGSNNVFVATSSKPFGVFANSGSTLTSGTTISAYPEFLAVDTNPAGPFVWVVTRQACQISSINYGAIFQFPANTTATQTSKSPITTSTVDCTSATNPITPNDTFAAAVNNPLGIAVDANNNLWVVNDGSSGANASTVTYLVVSKTDGSIPNTSAGSITTAANFGGVNLGYTVAVDGANHAWIANGTGAVIPVLSASADGVNPPVITSLAGTTGYTTGAANGGGTTASPILRNSRGLGIDLSGNVWMMNNTNTGGTVINYVTVLVGQAAPVITPMALAVKAGKIGQRP
ncbi:MAG TPA: hypothetical protein VGB94_12005 [Acidobacteriaceae bacterium]